MADVPRGRVALQNSIDWLLISLQLIEVEVEALLVGFELHRVVFVLFELNNSATTIDFTLVCFLLFQNLRLLQLFIALPRVLLRNLGV